MSCNCLVVRIAEVELFGTCKKLFLAFPQEWTWSRFGKADLEKLAAALK